VASVAAEQLKLVSAIADELRAERDARRCCVCMAAERSTLMLPCKHAVLCETCATSVQESSGRCPLCRETIVDTIRMYG